MEEGKEKMILSKGSNKNTKAAASMMSLVFDLLKTAMNRRVNRVISAITINTPVKGSILRNPATKKSTKGTGTIDPCKMMKK